MVSRHNIRVCLLYEFKMGHNATEATRNIISAWGEGSMSEWTARRWFQKFRDGDFSLEDQEGRGRPSTVDHEYLKNIVEADPRITTRDIAKELDVDHSIIVRHLEAIGKVKKLDKWVPHELNESNMNRRFEVSSSLLLRNKIDPFLDRIVTCDEKWIMYDNRRRSAQWLDRDEAPKHIPKPNLHPMKTMVTVWWTAAGVIHYSFLKPGQTINADKYCEQIKEMHKKLTQIQPALVNRKGPIILHDNASRRSIQKLHELKYEILPHPPYSLDLSPTDYHFFKHLANFLQGKKFEKSEEAENAFAEFISSRNTDFYATGINKLVERWGKCVDSNGAYFD